LRWEVIVVLLLIAIRLILAAVLPLHFDEAYYKLWSENLAGGYYDHPPAVAFVIRLGTLLAGHGEFGVRFGSILLALPMTWAVYRTAEILFSSAQVAASAALYLNLTLMVAAGTVIATPDSPLMVASALVLLFLAKVQQSGHGPWWLAVGVAAGAALLSKYTALFLGAAIVLWLILVPELRRWFLTPWPYLGGVVALAMFSPVLMWNAEHGWASFIKQLGRAHFQGLRPDFLLDLLPTQILLATPPIFFLGAAGLIAMLRGRGGTWAARTLIGVMVWPIVAYFLWHSSHKQVPGNWLAPIYPAFVIAAAVAADQLEWKGWPARLIDMSRSWAVPVGIAMTVLAAGLFSFGPVDQTQRVLGAGWDKLAAEIETVRARLGATTLITTSYAVTASLSYHMPRGTPVVQINDRIRWVNMPQPERSQLERALYVVGPRADRHRVDIARMHYRTVEPIAEIARMRRGVVIDTFQLYLAEGLTRPLPPSRTAQSQ
jgi:4-amino-4-deoxy-L-arabinose transferase-like glycosyltransferase